ncbi:MAG: DUF3443 family protein, partial [Terriglobales bacterium]
MKGPAVALLAAALALAGCGGGGGNNTPPPINNTLPVVTNLGVNNDFANGLFASVTVCVPGTSTCQTINNVLVDTGSFGLRLLASQVNLPLPPSQDAKNNPLGECVQFASSFNWGPVVSADIQLAGEKAAAVPMQILGEPGFPAPPAACASSGLTENDTQATLGANGVLGLGVFRFDCGPGCSPPSSTIPPVYFGCPSTGCSPVLVAQSEQVQNPAALFPQDNNGLIVRMPGVAAQGAPSVNGSVIFGIGTETNNAMAGATVLEADGFGNFSTQFLGTTYTGSILDTGSNANFFLDSATVKMPDCTVNTGFYCPSSIVSFSATNIGASNTASAAASWQVANADNLFTTSNAAFPDLGGPNPNAFDFGLPFFFGR